MREDFSEFELPQRVVERIGSSESALFDYLRSIVTDEMLIKISRADYGLEASKHLKELKRLRELGAEHGSYDWHPNEVLSVVAWSDLKHFGLEDDAFGNTARAFCAAAQLMPVKPYCSFNKGSPDGLIPLLESLGSVPRLAELIPPFVVSRIQSMKSWDTEFLFWSFALVYLAHTVLELPTEDRSAIDTWFLNAHLKTIEWQNRFADENLKIFYCIPFVSHLRQRWMKLCFTTATYTDSKDLGELLSYQESVPYRIGEGKRPRRIPLVERLMLLAFDWWVRAFGKQAPTER